MNSRTSLQFVVGLLCASSLTATAAVVANGIVLTENSDTSLTADYYNGSSLLGSQTVTASPNDTWTFTTSFLLGLTAGGTDTAAWAEPDNSQQLNKVVFTPLDAQDAGDQNLVITVNSDYPNFDITRHASGDQITLPDGISATFVDDGDGTVPDPAFTALLLLASAGGLFGLNNWLQCRSLSALRAH